LSIVPAVAPSLGAARVAVGGPREREPTVGAEHVLRTPAVRLFPKPKCSLSRLRQRFSVRRTLTLPHFSERENPSGKEESTSPALRTDVPLVVSNRLGSAQVWRAHRCARSRQIIIQGVGALIRALDDIALPRATNATEQLQAARTDCESRAGWRELWRAGAR
jgi:hypothetical protein